MSQVLGEVTRDPLSRVIPLEVSPNIQEVIMTSDEFTSLCPVTGQPDFSTVSIRFIPRSYGIESKSLKLYLLKFRNEGVFCESLSNQIAEEIAEVIDPIAIEVTVTQKPRGGVSIIARATVKGQTTLEQEADQEEQERRLEAMGRTLFQSLREAELQ